MKINNRFVRLGAVVASVSLLTTQISTSGNLAFAQTCPPAPTSSDDGGGGGSTGAIVAGAAGGAAILAGIFAGGGAATAGAAGIGAIASGTIAGALAAGGVGPGFSIIAGLIDSSGLGDVLAANGRSFTFFAPSDEAFSRLPKGVLDELKKDKERLRKLLEGHIVENAYTEGELTGRDEGFELTTRAGTKLRIGGIGGLTVNGIRALQTDIKTGNGIIHTIDGVILNDEG